MQFSKIKQFFGKNKPGAKALDFIKYIGPGLLVTIGFIDPGNWATNIAAGSRYGYSLLWVVTLGTVMLIILQHNSAHLGIVTGYCLSEAATFYLKPWISKSVLLTAVFAAIATALAEILGAAIALEMLFKIPIKFGAFLVALLLAWLLWTNSYRKLERLIIGFISLIGLSFLIELSLIHHLNWPQIAPAWVIPVFPKGAMLMIMSVLGAVVMPHNMFLHSEIIQSRECNLQDEPAKVKNLKYEFLNTSFAMLVGWAINSAMILVAAQTFFVNKIAVTNLDQAEQMLKPLLGNGAALIFALALLFAGVAAAITAGIAGGTIFAGIFGEAYDINDAHTKVGAGITIVVAVLLILGIQDAFTGLIYSQMALGIQLPITVFLQIYMTSSPKLMGKYVNSKLDKVLLWSIGILVTMFNILLLLSIVKL
jgi:manganese transport protein